ncbi:hypothetical protein HDU80_005876 [Chytriomyces hyalinus]|nr:hypothetical protein HDU80_005876 [Chytriomyces hyalinus]
MPALRLLPVVKKYKSQKLEQGAIQLDAIDFDRTYDKLKQTLWELAQPKIKGLARIVNNELQLDRTVPTIDSILNFVVISKSSRSYTFGEVATPLYAINEDLSNITKRGSVDSLTTFIFKVGDYERVNDRITGGAAAQDHAGLIGEDMVWNSWAGMLLQNQETLEEQIVLPPPQVTVLFERQSHSERQLHHIKHSFCVAIDVVEEQDMAIRSLKRSIEYALSDLQNQMHEQQRNLSAHKHAIQSILNAVSPEETDAAASTLDSVVNIPDDDHSVASHNGDRSDQWTDAVGRED